MPDTRTANPSSQAFERAFAPEVRRGPARRVFEFMCRFFGFKKKVRKKGNPNIYPLY